MASLPRTHRAGGKNQVRVEKPRAAGGELCVPAHFRCPISLELMRDPVTLPTGITYDRQSIETWFDMGNTTCPATNRTLAPRGQDQLLPNHALRRMIQDWCVAHRHHGVERIPTPRIPVAAADVAQMLSEVASASRSGDAARCRGVVSRIRSLGKESERNRRCIAYNGAAAALSDAFASFSVNSRANGAAEAKEEILAALTGMFPLGKDACACLGLPESLRCIGLIASSGDLAARLNAVLVLKEVVHGHGSLADAAANTDGMADALVKLIREPISPQATKASLVAIFYMVSAEEKTASKKFVDMGLVPLLLEILVDVEKSTAEKALGVLDGICSCREGRRAAYEHALTTPVLVKKIFRVSDVATNFSVSALWKLCKNYRSEWGEAAAAGRAGCPEEALRVGAFQKLLLLLQVGCGEATKEKASELLKMLNSMRATAECIESGDFKGLKRPF